MITQDEYAEEATICIPYCRCRRYMMHDMTPAAAADDKTNTFPR
jgi:hypothetical protein